MGRTCIVHAELIADLDLVFVPALTWPRIHLHRHRTITQTSATYQIITCVSYNICYNKFAPSPTIPTKALAQHHRRCRRCRRCRFVLRRLTLACVPQSRC